MKKFSEFINENNHAEPWDDAHKRLKDANFISCVEDYELDSLIEELKKQHNGKFSEEKIFNAIQSCCLDRGEKIGRDYFIKCVNNQLK